MYYASGINWWHRQTPIELIVSEKHRLPCVVKIDYHGGERYPHLSVELKFDMLDRSSSLSRNAR